jgi:hypothetical protein
MGAALTIFVLLSFPVFVVRIASVALRLTGIRRRTDTHGLDTGHELLESLIRPESKGFRFGGQSELFGGVKERE